MKPYLCFILMFFSAIAYAQNENPNYDSQLAEKYGADDYGMKKFIFVILKTGSNTSTDTAFTNKCFAGHMANINKLVKDQKLLVAGPMKKNENKVRGIFILDTPTIETAKELLLGDLAVTEKIFEPEYYEWYGSAALAAYLEASDKIWKVSP